MNKLTTIEREKISNQKHFANELSFNKYLSSVEAVDMITNITGVNISNPKFEEVIEDKKRIDILFEAGDDEFLIVESQFGKTNHDHLGKLISYSAQSNKYKWIVWIVEEHEGLHSNAINILNNAFNNADSPKYFFLLKAEIIKLKHYEGAGLNLEVIESPDNIAPVVSYNKDDLSETRTNQLNFWIQLNEYAVRRGEGTHKPRAQQWSSFSLRNKIDNVTNGLFTIGIREQRVRVGFDFNKELENEDHIAKVESYFEKIQNEYPDEKMWFTNNPNNSVSRIYFEKELEDIKNVKNDTFNWMLQKRSEIESFIKSLKNNS